MLCVMFCVLLRSVECNCLHAASGVHLGCAQHPFYIGFNVNFTIYILPCSELDFRGTLFLFKDLHFLSSLVPMPFGRRKSIFPLLYLYGLHDDVIF